MLGRNAFPVRPLATLLRPFYNLSRGCVLALLLATCAACPSFAQDETNDVHVVPREQKKDAKPDPTVMPPAVAAEAKAAGVVGRSLAEDAHQAHPQRR